jgi:2-methylisocitrate lyase-like PEP mutase family enzyme
MDLDRQRTFAATFLARHHRPAVLLLPNVWDAMSARLFTAAGFDALATTSGGVAWALGYPDGEHAPWADVVAATARIVRCTQVPVTADIEAGYGVSPAEVATHVAEIVRAGVVGVNLEDGQNGTLRSTEDMVARLSAAREAASRQGVRIVLNARCDVFHLRHGEDASRLSDAVERCNAYFAAGADCVYPFGLRDPETIAQIVKAVAGPVNITGRPGMPSVAELQRIGVARITIASAPTLVVMDAIAKLAAALRADGRFEVLTSALHRPDVQKMFQLEG